MKNVSNHQPGKFTSEFDSLRNIFKNKKNNQFNPDFIKLNHHFYQLNRLKSHSTKLELNFNPRLKRKQKTDKPQEKPVNKPC